MITNLTKQNIYVTANSILSKKVVLEELEKNPFANYLIYLENNKLIGYIYYSDIYERVEINQVEVNNSRRNCGIASKLMEYLIETLDKSITLEVRNNNIYAIMLYKKFGFKEKALRKGYYNGIDGILMERKHS